MNRNSPTHHLEAGWDFVDETANGADSIWWTIKGQDYPRLTWELAENCSTVSGRLWPVR